MSFEQVAGAEYSQQPIEPTGPVFSEPRGVDGLSLSALRFAARCGAAVAPRRTGNVCYQNYFRASPKGKVTAAELRVLERGRYKELPWESPAKALFPYSGVLRTWTWGAGPPVILVHGFAARVGRLAANFVDALVDAGHSVSAFELPGHGRGTNGHCDVFSAASALHRVAEHVGAPRAILAHSFGVCASALAMAQGTTCDCFVGIASLAWLEPLPAHFCDVLRLSPEVRRQMLLRVEQAFAPHGLARLATTEQVRGLQSPVMLIHDRLDPVCHWSGALAIQRACPNATLRLTSGLGHYRIAAEPFVQQEVARFISKGGQ